MSTLGAAVRGRPLRLLAELAGMLGATITGVLGAVLGAGIIALDTVPTTLAGVVLLSAFVAGAGPVGYDMAQSWVPEDERPPAAEAGLRAAAHAAGVAGALLFVAAVVGIAAAAPGAPTVVPALVALLGLPYLAAVGRQLAVRHLNGSRAVLPVSLAVIVVAAAAAAFVVLLLLGRLIGED